MLKSKTIFKKNDIITIKMISGEELIGKFIEDNDTHLTVKNPSVLGTDQNGAGIFPWILSASNDTVSIRHSTIAVLAACTKDIADKFLEVISDIKIVC